METVLEPAFATARSVLVSPLKSPVVTEIGPEPVVRVELALVGRAVPVFR